MQRKLLALALCACTVAVTVFAQNSNPPVSQLFTEAAGELSAMTFDSGSPVTVRGRTTTLVWPEAGSGMMLIEVSGGNEKYAFSTARVADMAKRGLTRFTIRPGVEVVVTGVLAAGGTKIGPGFTAARADVITRSDGIRVFNRAALADRGSK